MENPYPGPFLDQDTCSSGGVSADAICWPTIVSEADHPAASPDNEAACERGAERQFREPHRSNTRPQAGPGSPKLGVRLAACLVFYEA